MKSPTNKIPYNIKIMILMIKIIDTIINQKALMIYRIRNNKGLQEEIETRIMMILNLMNLMIQVNMEKALR